MLRRARQLLHYDIVPEVLCCRNTLFGLGTGTPLPGVDVWLHVPTRWMVWRNGPWGGLLSSRKKRNTVSRPSGEALSI